MEIKILTTFHRKEWIEVLSKVRSYDFYHTPYFHAIDSSGKGLLVVFRDGDAIAALPVILRKIPHTDLKNITSVYGYTGWISTPDFPFYKTPSFLNNYFLSEKVVSAFSRLHPCIEDSGCFYQGSVNLRGRTFGIDLTLNLQEQFGSYSGSVRRSINRNRQRGMSVLHASGPEDMRVFYELYVEAMKRMNASAYYYFSFEYMMDLVFSPDFKTIILFAELEGEIIGGGMFLICNSYMAYHLGAVKSSFVHYSPLKFIIDSAVFFARDNQLKILHLGGGRAGKEDGLAVFKSRLSTLVYSFKTWEYIVKPELYAELCQRNNHTGSSFFPLYRA